METTNRLSGSENRRPTEYTFSHRQSFSESTPIQVPAPMAAHWPAWTAYLPRHMPRLAFPLFCVVATAPSAVVMAVPVALWVCGLPPLSGLALGIMAIALTWGGLAIWMRYQECWESAPPPPQQAWRPPAAPAHIRAVFS